MQHAARSPLFILYQRNIAAGPCQELVRNVHFRMRILSFNATILIILLIFPLSALAQTGKASAPYFDDIIVTTSDTHLLLFGVLRNSLTDEMIAGLHNGIPITFSFFIELEENLPNWPDTQLTALSFTHSLSFDTLKDRYIVETEEYNNRKTSLASLEDAAVILKEINGLKIIKLSELKPDRTYRIRVKADLYKKTLPMSLHTVIPFISWWDLSTDWYTVEFTY